MAIHDAWARITPYELLVPDEAFARERFPAIADEAREREVETTDLDRFSLLGAVAEALRELRGPDEDPHRIRQHALLLYHAWHFRTEGSPLWLLSTVGARWVVEASAAPDEARPPSKAGYLQLPLHLFWSASDGGSGDAVPALESLDGIFWTVAGASVNVLGVLGIRGDRPGYSVVPLPPLPLEDAGAWVSSTMREEGDDFASDMPGAELDALYEVRTPGELLKLLGRSWSLVDPEAGPESGPDASEEDDQPGGPRPSGLPFRRISLT